MSQSTNFVDLWSILIIDTTKAPFDSKKIGHRNLFRGKTLRVSSSSVNTMLPHSAMPSEIGMIKVFIFFSLITLKTCARITTHTILTLMRVCSITHAQKQKQKPITYCWPPLYLFFYQNPLYLLKAQFYVNNIRRRHDLNLSGWSCIHETTTPPSQQYTCFLRSFKVC